MSSKRWQKSEADLTHYEVLGIGSKSSQEEVKKAFLKLTKEHHPDTGGCTETSKRINVAYSVLGDKMERQAYDAQIEKNTWRPSPADPGRPATPQDLYRYYNFTRPDTQKAASRVPRNILTAMILSIGSAMFASYMLLGGQKFSANEQEDDDNLESGNYSGGYRAQQAAKAHRRVRNRTRELSSFEEQLKFVESRVMKRPYDPTPKVPSSDT